MECDKVRFTLSARLDGEEDGPLGDAVDTHLAACRACREWLTRAERVTRAVRLQAVRVPDLTARILAAAREAGALPSGGRSRGWAAPSPEPNRRRRPQAAQVVRWALGLLAVLQLMLALPDLLGAVGHDAHAGREVAAFDVALAVGLLIAACYPEYARVFAPVVLTLVACFAMISALDVVQGVVSPERVAVHMIAVAQAGLLWLLARGVAPRPATPR